MLSEIGQKIFEDRYALYEGERYEDAAERVASVVPQNYRDAVMQGIIQKKIVPAGRIWRSVGTSLTGYNCYVLPSPEDSREGIVKTLADMIEIMSHGGGVGINLATLRPTGAKVVGVSGKSSGPVSWGEIYSFATGLIEQGGSRRGALMLTLPIWHPSVVEFITIKQTPGRMENANLSVLVSDHFMKAVQEDEEWSFVFPDTTDPLYETWDGDIYNYKGSILSHGGIKARDLWDMIAESAWKSAEPGVIFWDTVEKTFAGRWDGTKPVCVNPCSEQPLPAYGVCNLAHINVAEFYSGWIHDHFGFDWNGFSKAVYDTVVLLNSIIDSTNAVLPEVQEQQRKERRIGIGILGLHDFLIQAGIVYGSDQSLDFVDELFYNMWVAALEASCAEAMEHGHYENFNAERYAATNEFLVLKEHRPDLADAIRTFGLRNASLLTVAPTGTVGTMLDRSTGIEPHYAFEYERTSRLGTHKIRPQIAEGHDLSNPLFVTAQTLTPEEHLSVLVAAQTWVDSSISKTVNLPANASVFDVQKLYFEAWRNGVKGITVYRDGSRHEQVLSVEKPVAQKCEECGGDLIYAEGCATCQQCGASFCSV